MSRCAINQSNYIPWKGYFDLIGSVDQFILYDSRQYTKNDWRNRNRIKTANGPLWLSIPVVVPTLHMPIDEVKVADPKWAKKHWASICQNYSRTEFFADYKDVFAEFYEKSDEQLLTNINEQLIRTICQLLGITTTIYRDTEFELEGDRVMRLINLCKQLGADTYISGPRAKDYMDENLFNQHGIKVEWMDYSGYPEHKQRFEPFEHAVSVLDLLFNEGPRARQFMKCPAVEHSLSP